MSGDPYIKENDEALSRRLTELRAALEALVKAVEKDAMRAKEGR